MKIAVLSFEISDEHIDEGIGPMVIDSGKRIQYIKDIIKEHKPSLLVCSGYTVDTNQDLDNLVSKLKEIKTDSALLVEVKIDEDVVSSGHSEKYSNNKIIRGKHKMFFIDTNQKVKDLGPQYFATTNDLESKIGKELIEDFDNNIEQRKFTIDNKNVFALICGELSAIKGRDDIIYRSDKIKEAIQNADIILNPTHDCMANYGTLIAKRKFLSEKIDDRTRVYINSSNWNSFKKQKPLTNSFMQNFYINGEKMNSEAKLSENKDYLLSIEEVTF